MKKYGILSIFCALAMGLASCSNGGSTPGDGKDGKKESGTKCRHCRAQSEQVVRSK